VKILSAGDKLFHGDGQTQTGGQTNMMKLLVTLHICFTNACNLIPISGIKIYTISKPLK
jgi:hypothetical protein